MFSFLRLARTLISREVLVCSLLFLQAATVLQAQKNSPGIAWHVQGTWRIDSKGAPVHDGDEIKPASLLQPDETAGNHSIAILLPDGQHILYECFTAADCARGFRVPSLIRKPDPFALDMLDRIGAVLSRKHNASHKQLHTASAPQSARQEAVVVLNRAHRVHVAGLVAELPNGRYTYDLRPRDRNYPAQFHLTLEKKSPSIRFAVPASGLYDITITDALNTPRIDLLLTAIQPHQSAMLQSFRRARTTMETWNDDYAGWPIDDFLRAYMESLLAPPRH
jgi:hypothetical protein